MPPPNIVIIINHFRCFDNANKANAF